MRWLVVQVLVRLGVLGRTGVMFRDFRFCLFFRFLPRTQQGRPSSIQLRPESAEELRKRLREMSDLELRRFGQRARKLSAPKMNFGATEPHVIAAGRLSTLR